MKIDGSLKKKLKAAVISKLKDEQESTIIVETPYPISEKELASFKAHFPLGKKKLINKVVPDLIGGFVIKFNSKVIDVSIKREIDSIVEEIVFA